MRGMESRKIQLSNNGHKDRLLKESKNMKIRHLQTDQQKHMRKEMCLAAGATQTIPVIRRFHEA